MRIFRLNPSGGDRQYCRVDGAFACHVALQEGGEILPSLKAKGVQALEYYLDEARGGLRVGDYYTTVTNHLPVSRRFADSVAANFNLGRYEFLPARIKNEKGRIHASEVVILNPLGTVDCLDWDRSELDGDVEDPMVRIFGKWSLKADRVPADRDLFRVKGLIGYLFSERLVSFIGAQKFENFKFDEAPLS